MSAQLAPEVDYAANMRGVEARVEAALRRSGRPAGSVKIVAVSKTQPAS